MSQADICQLTNDILYQNESQTYVKNYVSHVLRYRRGCRR